MTNELIISPSQQVLLKPIATPKDLLMYHASLLNIIREFLVDGMDYGVIPKTKKATLLKPGAEKINIAFGTHPEYFLIEKEIDHDRVNEYLDYNQNKKISLGLYRYVYKCKITKSDGRVIGEGDGVCSTLESKYISRPRDTENTASKMAQKRAFMAATLNAFALSDMFTQDLEDMHTPEPEIKFEKSQMPKQHPKHPPPMQQPEYPEQPPMPPTPPQHKAPLMFDASRPKHLERFEQALLEAGVAPNVHAELAQAFHGTLFTQESVNEFIEKIREIEINKHFEETAPNEQPSDDIPDSARVT